MELIGIYEAKSKLSQLIERAEAGEEVTITRRGRPVAKLVAAREKEVSRDRAKVFAEIEAFAKTVRLKRRVSDRELRKMWERGRD